jgi:hypothetical protein
MKQIGSGSFTVAFRDGDGKVILNSVDPVKRAMSSGKLPKSELFPEINYIGKESKRVHSYSMKHYTTLSSRGIDTYSEISRLKRELTPKHAKLYVALTEIAIYHSEGVREFIRAVKKLPDEFATEREDIIRYTRALSKETKRKLSFEVHSFNVAVEDRKLILLDCFYPMRVAMYDY